MIAMFAVAASLGSFGCKGANEPRANALLPFARAVTLRGHTLRAAVAVEDGAAVVAALSTRDGHATLAAEGARSWRVDLTGSAGPVAASGHRVYATVSGSTTIGVRTRSIAVEGGPGAAIVAVDARSGAVAWQRGLDATEWVVVSATAASPDAVYVAGSFSGSLRVGQRIVTSGGKSDGFVVRVAVDGTPSWLVRVGGNGADAIQGVATARDRVAIAGTFTTGADLLGAALPPRDERSPLADAFVATLGPDGTRGWTSTFGGTSSDSVAGVAIDDTGRVAVAATARDVVTIGAEELEARGAADGLLAWWSPTGQPGRAVLLGGTDFDGLRTVVSSGSRTVVGGFFSGELDLGTDHLRADGGDGAFIAAFDRAGDLVDAWNIAGPGREEIVSLAALPGGFVAGVAHTAGLALEDAAVGSPEDPLEGAAVIARPVP